MTLKEASKHALSILKQVMEEKLNATNIEVFLILKILLKNHNFIKRKRCAPYLLEKNCFIYLPKKK